MDLSIALFRKYVLPALLGVLVVIALLRSGSPNLTTSANKLENYITEAENLFDRISESKIGENQESLREKGIYLYHFDAKDSLLFYTDNSVWPASPYHQVSEEANAVKLKNGWYLQLKRTFADSSILIGLAPLKYAYRFENKFLRNEFTQHFKIPNNFNIVSADAQGSAMVHNREGKVIFALNADLTHADNDANIALVLIYLLIMCIVAFYLNEGAMAVARVKGPLWGFGMLALIMMVIRFLMTYFKMPSEIYKLELFNPAYYGSAFFAESLGDLTLTCAMLFWLASFYYRIDRRFSLSLFPRKYKTTEQVFLLLLQYLASGSILWLFKSLVMDSVISFQVYDILSLTSYSFIGLTCLTLFLVCHFLLSINAFSRLVDLETGYVKLILITLTAGIFFVWWVFDFQYKESIIFTGLWSLFFTLTGYRVFKRTPELKSTRSILIFILLYSILSMFLIENLYELKERNQRQFFASKLVSGHDYIAEFTFDDIATRIAGDNYVKNFFRHPMATRKDLRDRIASLYFSGYFSKYDLKVYAYDTLLRPVKNDDTTNYYYFREDFDRSDGGNTGQYLRYVTDSLNNASYISIIPVTSDSVNEGRIILYLKPKIYNGQNVYPELLLGQNITTPIDNSAYDFAIYTHGKLSVQHGDFPYSYYWDKKYEINEGQSRFVETDQWEHLICGYPNGRKVIVSIPQEGFFEPVATVSYFFVIYFVIITLILGIINLFQMIRSGRPFAEEWMVSFQARINYSMLFIIIISFVVIGFVTIGFFRNQYDNFYTDRLQRKEKAILASIEYYIEENYNFNNQDQPTKKTLDDLLNIELVKLSDIQTIDINIFSAGGDLATTSQPSIFDYGLISKRMDPVAYHNLTVNHETQYTQQEHIGGLNYSATYAPIRNKAGNTIAFLSVPYFEKSKTINDEVSSFLVTLMNAYVFLLLCGAVLAYFISNSITRPLRFISEKLRILNLNKKNEPIEWRSKDEIGVLISEYNKMIAELESSASKLAKSERESAWREMARQIAHEIKNPLTPMKLSIQYLQRAIDENSPNVTELAGKVNKTLIEQIENLSSIATAFSSFAQMPKSNNEAVDLNEILRGVAALFEKEENVDIVFNCYKDPAWVFADKNQLISVFNNLIKNAIQSVPEDRIAEINLITLEEYGNIKTVVIDNGMGIPKESYEKVFVPNFTTKSSGTGLGLAITRQIIEGAKGEIWFESEVGHGTSFYVALPYYKEYADQETED